LWPCASTFELRALLGQGHLGRLQRMAVCKDRNAVGSHHTPFSGAHCLANRSGPLVRLTFQIGRRGECGLPKPCDLVSLNETFASRIAMHSQGCSLLSRTGLLFPVNHTLVGDPGLAPGRLGDFKSPGSAFPAEASRREMVGMKGLAPPRLPDSESGPSAVRV
jgi:hypothetical protein